MAHNQKRLQKFLQNPKSLKYPHIETLLLYMGFQKIEAQGSHKKFKHSLLHSDLVIPVHNNDCKTFYKTQSAKIIKKLIK